MPVTERLPASLGPYRLQDKLGEVKAEQESRLNIAADPRR